MFITERVSANSVLLSFFVLFLTVFILSIAVPAQAHDGTVGSETTPIVFNDLTPYAADHEDASPWKGFFMLWTQNSTSNTWIGFNFTLSGTNGVFINPDTYGDCSWAYDGDCYPRSSKGINTYSISPDQTSMTVYFNNNWSPTQTGWIRVYTDNTADSSGTFTVTSTPIVPEPVSSTLFIVGGATLGFRRFRKKFSK
jgi:hypothetical protein